MTQYYQTTVTTVQSGHTLSNEINIKGVKTLGIFCPVVTSCQLFFQVAPGFTSPTSATYVRMATQIPASGMLIPWTWPVGPGSLAAVVQLPDIPFSFGRIEASVSQQAQITYTVVYKA